MTYNLARASARYASRTVRGGRCPLRLEHLVQQTRQPGVFCSRVPMVGGA